MSAVDKTNVTANRGDISQFVIHLTRDCPSPESQPRTARENLSSILKSLKIEARNPHCFHNPRLTELDDNGRKSLNVVCFTECPLNQLYLITQHVEGRKVKLCPYGLVFRRTTLIEAGAQPALYLNGYASNKHLRDAGNALFDLLKANSPSAAVRFLPFLNVMSEKYDFSWEREWRVLGDFTFKANDIVCVILPESGDDDLKKALAKVGVAYISPGWRYEKIVSELARQQKHTKKELADAIKAVQK